MLLFEVPEGRFSQVFWRAVFFTCHFGAIGGGKALILLPPWSGLMYSALALLIMQAYRLVRRKES